MGISHRWRSRIDDLYHMIDIIDLIYPENGPMLLDTEPKQSREGVSDPLELARTRNDGIQSRNS
jgi:hypothetical protein